MKLKINLNGIEVILKAIKRIMKEKEFKEDVTEDYKKGFYDFGNAVLKAFDKE